MGLDGVAERDDRPPKAFGIEPFGRLVGCQHGRSHEPIVPLPAWASLFVITVIMPITWGGGTTAGSIWTLSRLHLGPESEIDHGISL